ncbi:MAG: hypothetical protein ACKVRN_13985 [Pyrinomonadaceae bacterium]
MKNSLNLCLAILFLVVLGCSCPKLSELAKQVGNSPAEQATPSSADTDEEVPKPAPKSEVELTMAKYQQLSIGMPRSEVENILGSKGTEMSSSSGGGMRFSVNKWDGENFKAIILTFKNDKIMSKSQVGLEK